MKTKFLQAFRYRICDAEAQKVGHSLLGAENMVN